MVVATGQCRALIHVEVSGILREALGLEPDREILLSDRLVGDLGADFVDLLDIQFRAQKKFEIPELIPSETVLRLKASAAERANLTVEWIVNRVFELRDK